jgi:hypothetical protein
MPEGADGSAYYRDGTCGTEGAGAFLRVRKRLPDRGRGCAGLHVFGSLHAGRVRERQQARRTAGNYNGTGRSTGVTLDENRCSSARRVRKPRLAVQQT